MKGNSHMPKKKTGDPDKLVKMIEDQIPQADIMKKLGIKTSTQLKTAYANALMASGRVPAIMGGRGSQKSESKKKLVGVGKRGSIIVPADVVSGLGFGKNEQFAVRKTKSGLALKKV
jgi:hypothetical protein